MKKDRAKIRELLAQIFDELQKIDNSEDHMRRQQDFIFHMLDWQDDLEQLSAIYANPEKYEDDSSKIIAGFLYHVIPHINMAGHLLLENIPDPFEDESSKQVGDHSSS